MRERLLERAAKVDLTRRFDVAVAGGGAAGLVSAIVAAEAGANVCVIERDLEAGRRILATGNGRCNICNTNLAPSLYHSSSFVEAVCGERWYEDVRDFFRDSGLVWVEEGQGRLYPLSRQAASVREVLISRATRAHVTFACAREVATIEGECDDFGLGLRQHFGTDGEGTLSARRVIIATGHDDLLTQASGLPHSPFRPLLTPLATTRALPASLDGRRAHGRVLLLRDDTPVAEESGEVLFRHQALTGIAVFNLSRHARTGDVLSLDLIPTLTASEAQELAAHTLAGLLDPPIASALEGLAGSRKRAVALAKDWRLEVAGPAQTELSQVMRGGLDTDHVHTRTLESKVRRGIFCCGESLDVDGPCGGFNLAWAWKSALVAGACAAASLDMR